MNDRELLELAAKAAGYPIHTDAQFVRAGGGAPKLYMGNSGPEWNPLTDDGDALRLAVKLCINLRHISFLVSDAAEIQAGVCGEFWPGEKAGGDPLAAARRAIVRAAAEIGKAMP